NVGDRFTLDLFVSAGIYNITAQQAYLTFTNELLQNVAANQPGCVLTNTVTGDFGIFDTQLQNEVCNGPDPCTFRSIMVDPGSIAFASGSIINPTYNGP